MLGMQGAGKGTHGDMLISEFGCMKLETGALLRKISKEDTELGKRVHETIRQGQLIDDDTIISMIAEFLEQNHDTSCIVFDGFPRTKKQYEKLRDLMKELHRPYVGIFIDITHDEALKRLSMRKICDQCRRSYAADYDQNICKYCGGNLTRREDDQNQEAIEHRIGIYTRETIPVIEMLTQDEKLIRINGQQSIEGVYNDIKQSLLRYS